MTGLVEQVGTPEEVYRRPKTRFVASFLGAMNWIDGVGLRPELSGSRGSARGIAGGDVKGSTFLGPMSHVELALERATMEAGSMHGAGARGVRILPHGRLGVCKLEPSR